MREIRINKVLNGVLVNVGCQTLVFNSTEEFITELRRYLKDPTGTEKEFLGRYDAQMNVPREAVPLQGADQCGTAADEPYAYAQANPTAARR